MASSRLTAYFVPGQDRSNASYEELDLQIRHELDQVWRSTRMSQAEFARELGYQTATQISQLRNGQKSMTPPFAKLLDKWGVYTPTLGVTFQELVAERDAIPRKDSVGKPQRKDYDVFLAAPMAAAVDRYDEIRQHVMDVRETLATYAKCKTYCAAKDIVRSADFDNQKIAYETNLEAIQACRQFVAFLPVPVPLNRTPSSVWVEAGMALARSMPCTFFVPTPQDLPYVLQRAMENRTIDVHFHGDNIAKVSNDIRKHGRDILAGTPASRAK
ncbi:helix-turn-helix domain-containing protein [Mycolicibacterium neoaurum]|uniref:helix-turn-helix domain-containing protein n=1 Tax=Mycolicibacterium neoaurum TaxID=1795 RepID=UPI001F4C7647|nr:helix-turn-helix transcriptional regulator [Mycolicibacterium neoaurum]